MSIKYTLAEIEALTKPCPKADANTNIQNWKVRTETPCPDCAALKQRLEEAERLLKDQLLNYKEELGFIPDSIREEIEAFLSRPQEPGRKGSGREEG